MRGGQGAAGLAEGLLDALGVEKAIVVGHSAGTSPHLYFSPHVIALMENKCCNVKIVMQQPAVAVGSFTCGISWVNML